MQLPNYHQGRQQLSCFIDDTGSPSKVVTEQGLDSITDMLSELSLMGKRL
jgi:hypothetical protein